MPDRDEGIKRQAEGIVPPGKAVAPATERDDPVNPASEWEDNPFRRPGVGWEGTFADAKLVSIVVLACLVGPAALSMGLMGVLFLHGPRARRQAWIMVVVAIPMTVAWVLLMLFGKKE